ncbi:hypothetical protein [Arthrobacter castelli]|uniref:hypothetical protein n=1 Tax=Arthrobacter castelli TaxID=271431 RepID=UPI0003F71B7B|nr:hypothetical protein [Arthrobacter castelli]
MTDHAEPVRPFGAVITADGDIESLLARLADAGTSSVGFEAGPGNIVGLHLGTVPRHGIRDSFAQQGISIEAVAAPVNLDARLPDEGVVADVDAYLKLTADVGAKRLKLAAGTVPSSSNGDDAGSRQPDPGVTARSERISHRLAAVMGRAADRDVQLVVENSSVASGAEELAVVLEAAHTLAPDASAGAAWNVRRSVAAGEELDLSAKLLRPYLAGGAGYILCETAATATALLDAVPAVADIPILIEPQSERS